MDEIADKQSSELPDVSTTKRRCFLVRSCRQIPLEEHRIGIGWDDMPFNEFPDGETLLAEMDATGWNIVRNRSVIRRYMALQRGDLVVVPWWGTILLAEVRGERHYDDRFYDLMGSNQVEVRFVTDAQGAVRLIPRSDLSESLQRRLKTQWAVTDLWEFETEISKLFSDLCCGRPSSFVLGVQTKQAELIESFKRDLLANIHDRRTGLQTGGLGMEALVAELLEIDGFEVAGLAKTHFGSSEADADLEATRTNALRSDEYLVQVKHHEGASDGHGVRQLLKIHEDFPDYRQHQLVWVTSGNVDRTDKALAEKHDVIVKDGTQLVEWILTSMPHLKATTLAQLGILNVPRLATSLD